ncbi:hypothetical protein [Pedobacter endophyticus]|uniref:Uncharacterized protein n=1 Tax=Pedobacter endophyticus TaxID=2789740 RepID=A0A7U3Q585_9SPHI|nr:hypothetical protein [Pedobacter endophyticus]QPH38833.1 hypothetical protein IZT61_17430 [Pedobacter endophyticus]
MLEFEGKTIIFGAPTTFGFSSVIKPELERVGLKVFDFSPVLDSKFKYKNIWQRIHNVYRKVFFKDYANKKKLQASEIEHLLMTSLMEVPKADFSFFIRPDLFPSRFIEEACKKSGLSVAYQWDGLDRYPKIYNYLKNFDRFFVFDKADITTATLSLTNFFIPDRNYSNTFRGEKAYFCGSYINKKRFSEVAAIAYALQPLNIPLNFLLVCDNKKLREEIEEESFTIIADSIIPYSSNLENVKNCTILVEVQNPVHEGLSFRVFEALNYNKKLITTNAAIKSYDFYDPANIFVWNGENSGDLESFLNTPMKAVSEKVKNKYGFDNWIKYVLDYGRYDSIDLPESK